MPEITYEQLLHGSEKVAHLLKRHLTLLLLNIFKVNLFLLRKTSAQRNRSVARSGFRDKETIWTILFKFHLKIWLELSNCKVNTTRLLSGLASLFHPKPPWMKTAWWRRYSSKQTGPAGIYYSQALYPRLKKQEKLKPHFSTFLPWHYFGTFP